MSPFHYVGGLETYTASLAKYLIKLGHEVCVVCEKPKADARILHNVKGINLFFTETPAQYDSSPNAFIKAAEELLEKLQKKHNFHILHAQCHDFAEGIVTMRVGDKYEIPVILTVHDPTFGERMQYLTSVSKKTTIIVTSNFMKNTLIQEGADPNTLRIIPAGVDMEIFDYSINADDLRTRLDIERNDQIIFCPARFDPIKKIDCLFEAMTYITKEFPSTKMLLTGCGAFVEFPSYVETLKELANKLNLWRNIVGGKEAFTLQPRFTFSEISKAYALASLTVLPSVLEPFGLVILESMAMKKPVVVSRTGGITEFVKDGKTGMLFTPGDSKELAEKVIKILESKKISETISKKAFSECKRFDMAKITSEMNDIYQELTK
jgi:glycosyltransferase involved in cell wall biosynthesis